MVTEESFYALDDTADRGPWWVEPVAQAERCGCVEYERHGKCSHTEPDAELDS